MKVFLQAVRMSWRDWRSGELRLLLAALVVAVAAVTSVSFFVDRMRAGLDRDAAQLLGGDLVVAGDQPFPSIFGEQALRSGLRVARVAQFPSMAQLPAGKREGAEGATQLVGLKAVGPGYPLRGAVRVARVTSDVDAEAVDIPPPGAVWIDPQLLGSIGTQIGSALKIGDRVFRVDGILTVEPDRGSGFINFAPRVMMRLDELDSTGLIQPGSRVAYRLLVAGPPERVGAYQRWLVARLGRGERIESVLAGSSESARPDMNQTLSRARTFLSLVALLTVMLAAVAVALATRHYVRRHIDATAIMRCLGSTSTRVTTLFLTEFVLLGIAASLIGGAAGFAAHFLLAQWLASLVGAALPAASSVPLLQGFAAGMVLLIGFALPPLMQLRHVPPARVLRRDLGPASVPVVLTYGFGLAALSGLLLWFAGDPKLGLIAGGGFLCAIALFAGVTFAALAALAPARAWMARISVVLHFAFAGAMRRPATTVVQVVALAVGLMSLLLLTITRTDLVAGWREAAPADAPNRFVINIQPEQRDRFNDLLAANGLARQELLPMVRGRLVAVNGKPVSVDDYTGRARRLVDREFNLSYMPDPPAANRIVEGRWFAPDAADISVEQGLMKELGLALGDSVSFDVAGTVLQARIGSVRRVEWNSLKVNFFVIFPPRMLEPLQQTFITSFRMPAGRDIAPQLSARFPNLTIIDTGSILRQVQTMLDQVIGAVEFLFVFAVAAGALVLYAALVATRDERAREAGLLRALGASRRQLAGAQLAEFAFIGGLAGLMAALGAGAIGWAIATRVFEFSPTPNLWMLLGGTAAGLLISTLGGWLGLRGVLVRPPLQTLRDA